MIQTERDTPELSLGGVYGENASHDSSVQPIRWPGA